MEIESINEYYNTPDVNILTSDNFFISKITDDTSSFGALIYSNKTHTYEPFFVIDRIRTKSVFIIVSLPETENGKFKVLNNTGLNEIETTKLIEDIRIWFKKDGGYGLTNYGILQFMWDAENEENPNAKQLGTPNE